MGEVGANATETTAPPAADSSSSSSAEPKENGEVNGTTDTSASSARKDVSTVGNKDGDEEDLQEEVEENGTNSEADGSTGEAKDTEKATAMLGEEKQKKGKSTVAPSGEEKLHKADDSLSNVAEPTESDDASGKTNLSSRGGGSEKTERSKRPQESKEKQPSDSRVEPEEIESMDVDEEEEGDVVAVDAENGSQNGAAAVADSPGDGDKAEAASKRDQPKVVSSKQPRQQATEVEDDEPMEVDGEQDLAAPAPTNGHKESNAHDETVVRPEKLPSSKTASEKKDKSERQPTSKQPLEDEEEEDDDKPVSINSDSDSEESQQKRDGSEAAANKAAKPAANSKVILVDEGGLAKLSESGSQPAAAIVGLEAIVTKKSTVTDSVPSNGVDAVASTRNQNGDCDGDLTILSDKEDDCVVIEDDDGAAANLSMGGRGYQTNAANLKGQKSLLMNSATGTGSSAAGGKEATLVIIDTNTMMNNGGAQRGSSNLGTVTSPSVNSNAANLLAKASNAGILANVNVSPGGQFNNRSLLNSAGVVNSPTAGAMLNQSAGMLGKNAVSPLTPVTPLLPALTDDMFVLEAPSFIVPYIYEKPPADNLRDIVDELEVKIKEMRKKLEESGAVPPADKQAGQGEAGGSAASSEQNKEQESGKKDALASIYGDKDTDKNKNNKKRKRNNDDDDDWDELETSTDDEASDEEQKTKVLIKEAKADIEAIKEHIISPTDKDDLTSSGNDPKKSENYFENPLGKFFMNIGINLVQEFVQTDLLRQQKRKRDREGKPSPSTQLAINSLMKNLEQSKENNKPYKFEMKRCEYCPFKSESALVMAHHYETPHMRNFIYKCNFCAYETRPPHDILYHMEAVHNIKGRMEKALSYHHCPNCPFEDNGKSKLARHAVACAKKFRPELNLNPPMDWEPPAKIPRIKPKHGLVGTATAYQAMTAQQQKNIALANQQRLNQQQQVVSSP
uniref:C2H2-type domain-containing protein n=1 Tax=Anopheles christyi TaxID=43041 RepID=A0A182KHA3_9DIPT